MNIPPPFPPVRVDRPHVKVCGVTRVEDARLALELGATFIGLIFAEKSPRRISISQAKTLLTGLQESGLELPLRPIGVFVDEPIDLIIQAVAELNLFAVQLHVPRPEAELAQIPVPAIEAIRVRGKESAAAIENAARRGPVLLDTFVEGQHGGTGKVFDHSLAVPHIRRGPIFIAGGLNPQNIAGIAKCLSGESALPYAFDISSGLEASHGAKDHGKMRLFFDELGSR